MLRSTFEAAVRAIGLGHRPPPHAPLQSPSAEEVALIRSVERLAGAGRLPNSIKLSVDDMLEPEFGLWERHSPHARIVPRLNTIKADGIELCFARASNDTTPLVSYKLGGPEQIAALQAMLEKPAAPGLVH